MLQLVQNAFACVYQFKQKQLSQICIKVAAAGLNAVKRQTKNKCCTTFIT